MFSQPTEDIFISFKNEIIRNPSSEVLNIVCKNQETVEIKKKMLLLYSKLFRSIFNDERIKDDTVVYIPDYTKDAIENMIKILEFQWNEDLELGIFQV